MKGIFKNKPILITIIAIVLLLTLALVSSGSRTVSWIESAVGAVVTPVQTFAAKASNSIANFFRGVFNTTDADLENSRLKSELALYDQMQVELFEAQQENERLRSLLNYSQLVGDYEYATARVIGKSTGIWFDIFTINAGRNQGIDVNMPVICSDGLVGRVTEVGATWSKVISVIDSSVTVSVMVERTRDNCMLRGVLDAASSSNYLELYYLPIDRIDLVPGDVIITSGLGETYPKGIKIGVVEEVMLGTDREGVNAIVTPSVDFKHLEEVSVIISDISSAAETPSADANPPESMAPNSTPKPSQGDD